MKKMKGHRPVESIPELRKIGQTAFLNERANPYGRFIRFFSIYVTRLLLPLGTTANQASLLMIIVGTLATCFFLSSNPGIFLAGALLMQLWYTLDGVDGEIARYRHYKKTGSLVIDKRDGVLAGMYLDMINHYIINFLVPIMAGFGLYLNTRSYFWLVAGVVGSLAQVLMLAMHDAKCRTQLTHIKRFRFAEILDPRPVEPSSKGRTRSLAHWIFIVLHNTLTYPSVMNGVGLAAILNLFFPRIDWRMLFLCYVSAGSALVSGTLITRTVSMKINEEEVHACFRLTDIPHEKPEFPEPS
jgi:hypothetical protein